MQGVDGWLTGEGDLRSHLPSNCPPPSKGFKPVGDQEIGPKVETFRQHQGEFEPKQLVEDFTEIEKSGYQERWEGFKTPRTEAITRKSLLHQTIRLPKSEYE